MKFIDLDNTKIDTINKDEKAINNSIYNILSVEKGTMLGNPEFGTSLMRLLFRLIDPLLIDMIKTEIKGSLDRWEPRINVTKVEVVEDFDYNRVLITVIYIINKDPEDTLRSFIYKVNKEL